MKNGLNYLSQGWSYSESEDILRADFDLFRENNINLICLWLRWSQIEPSQGNYNAAFLERVRKLCEVAREYGIDVEIDFHSDSGSSGSYGLPGFISNFSIVTTNPTYKQVYINMLKHVVSILDGEPNIRNYHLFNEPQNTPEDSYYTLFKEAATAVRTVTTRPLGIRFGAWQFNNTWRHRTWTGIYNMIGLNCYIGLYGGHTQSNLQTSYNAVVVQGLDFELTEYGWDPKGYSDLDNEEQRSHVASQITIAETMGITTTLIVQYGRHYNPPYAFNLRDQSTGEPRPAFYEVAKANPTPIPPPRPRARLVEPLVGAGAGLAIGIVTRNPGYTVAGILLGLSLGRAVTVKLTGEQLNDMPLLYPEQT